MIINKFQNKEQYNFEQELSKFMLFTILPKINKRIDNETQIDIVLLSELSFKHGYNLANVKFEKAKELLEYFTKRVEEGSIKSKTTYKLYKEFLENN